MKYSELEKKLKQTCVIDHQGSRHTMWRNLNTGECFPVGRHSQQEVPKGTLHSILKKAGLKG